MKMVIERISVIPLNILQMTSRMNYLSLEAHKLAA